MQVDFEAVKSAYMTLQRKSKGTWLIDAENRREVDAEEVGKDGGD